MSREAIQNIVVLIRCIVDKLPLAQLVKATLPYKLKEIKDYIRTFLVILTSHMSGEFEVNIRDGKVTDKGKQVLQKISEEHVQFQYRARISDILTPWVLVLCGQPLAAKDALALQRIIPEVICEVEASIVICQQEILKNRRLSNHKLCAIKCENGPVVHKYFCTYVWQRHSHLIV